MKDTYLKVFMIALALSVIPIMVLLPMLESAEGLVGYDYLYFLPRLFEGVLFFKAQGIAIPYYSASFCAGLPFYADPQSMFYSFPQLTSIVLDPWQAVLWTSALFLFFGLWGMLLLFRHLFGFKMPAAVLGSVIFATNGFFRSRMAVGHFSYHSYMLIPLLGYCAASKKMSSRMAILCIGLIGAYFVHSGSHFVSFIAISALTVLLCLVYGVGSRHGYVLPRVLFLRLGLGGVIALLLSVSKLVAVTSFMSHFPRHTKAGPAMGVGEFLQTMVAQLFSPEHVPGTRYGIWEYDCSLSLLVLIGIILLGASLLKKRPMFDAAPWVRPISLSLLCICLYLTAETIAGGGFVYPILRDYPPFESLRATVRFTSVFVLLFTVLAALGFERMLNGVASQRQLVFIAVCFMFFEPLLQKDRYAAYLAFDATPTRAFAETIRRSSPEELRVQRLERKKRGDLELMAGFTSNIACLAPNFSRSPARHLKKARVDEVENGFFNFTDPSCYVYPEVRGCEARNKIAESDRENLMNILGHQNTSWKISAAQELANRISFLNVCVLSILSMFFLLRGSEKRRR